MSKTVFFNNNSVIFYLIIYKMVRYNLFHTNLIIENGYKFDEQSILLIFIYYLWKILPFIKFQKNL
jgi:hypothetical protein